MPQNTILEKLRKTLAELGTCNQAQLASLLPEVNSSDLAKNLNDLIKAKEIEIFQSKDKQLFYKYISPAERRTESRSQNLQFGDQYEKMVYEVIESSANLGIWIRDIRLRTSLTSSILQKILNSLEAKKYIKLIKSITASTKKLYMLFHLEPDTSISGGTFYTNQQLDLQLVSSFKIHILQFLEHKFNQCNVEAENLRPYMYAASIAEVSDFLSSLNLTNKPYKPEDIEQVLGILKYERKVEKSFKNELPYYYYSAKAFENATLDSYPCLVCPLINDCGPGNEVNPIDCLYMKNWMDF